MLATNNCKIFFFSIVTFLISIQLAKVTSHLRSKFCTVGDLCQMLVAYSKLSAEERKKCTLFSFLLDQP